MTLLSEAREFEASLEKEIKVLKKPDGKANSDTLAHKESILSALQNAKGAYPQQMLLSQIRYLQFAVGGSADQLPGKDTQIRLQELKKALQQLKAQAP